MLKSGVLVTASHNVSFAHNEENFSAVISAYENVLPKMRHALDKNTLRSLLDGPNIEPIFSVR